MTFQEGEPVYLEDSSGKRYWFRMAFEMIRVQSLGTVDGSKFADADDGSVVKIAGNDFTVFRPGVIELIESLDRGAQIITPKDAATILLNCNIRSGTTVIEVGAGSGGLTTALLNSVAPSGKVVTVELKEENSKRTRRNISRTGAEGCWECVMGNAKDVEFECIADALTMDMPDPWLALDNMLPHLRLGGRICIYVPNANQLESSVLALRERGFAGVKAMENIQRGMEVHPGGVRPSFEMLGHTGYLIFGRKRS
ncbi:MAG: tRNA (adenine-N1)-methyltransferase [Methanomassiliicoccaceae archaeon]|nr:tRNA (adenine-N1)-methyltransferase [Methanomassiliicoccaceae archaeon]